MQIASRNRQRLHWSGYEDIMSLSGSNILPFIHICKQIWDVWLRDMRDVESTSEVPAVRNEIQSIGIEEASNLWFEDIKQERGGIRRLKFIRFLGNLFYQKLVLDDSMSYPGHNGFSIEIEEMESDQFINNFLNEAADYGDLYKRIHTSKLKGEGKRVKYYITPILSSYFKIPCAHTKEPFYVNNKLITEWVVKSEAYSRNELSYFKNPQLKLKI
jgi:hypothetical protein